MHSFCCCCFYLFIFKTRNDRQLLAPCHLPLQPQGNIWIYRAIIVWEAHHGFLALFTVPLQPSAFSTWGSGFLHKEGVLCSGRMCQVPPAGHFRPFISLTQSHILLPLFFPFLISLSLSPPLSKTGFSHSPWEHRSRLGAMATGLFPTSSQSFLFTYASFLPFLLPFVVLAWSCKPLPVV